MLKWRDAFLNLAGSAWMCPRFLSLSLGDSQHLSAAAGLSVAAVGTCLAVTSHPRPSAACLSPLSLSLPLPVFRIPSSTLHVACQLCLAMVSLLGRPNHTSSDGLSVCSPPVSLSSSLSPFSSLSFNPPASELPMAVVCHLYTQDTLSLTDVTHNALRACHLSPSPAACPHHKTRKMRVKRVSTPQKCESSKT